MPTHDSPATPLPDIEELRARILADAPEPAADAADFRQLSAEARQAILTDELPERGAQIRVRFTGEGIVGNDVPVHTATQILDTLQGAITAVGSAVRKAKRFPPPKDKDGHRLGIKQSTELRLSPTIEAGSVVFFLEGPAHKGSKTNGQLAMKPSDTLVDAAVSELFDVLGRAQDDKADQIGQLTQEMQRLGAMVASKLHSLAEQSIATQIELDLGLRSPSGRRAAVRLRKRGADAIKEAVERNRTQVTRRTVTGRLNTVSDGVDKLRMTADDGKQLRLDAAPGVGVTLGPLLGQRVVAEVETTIVWMIATGGEKSSHLLLSADALPEVENPTD